MTQRKWILLLVFSFIIEAGSLTILRETTGKYLSPVLLLLAAIAGVYAGSKLLQTTPTPSFTPAKKISARLLGYIAVFAVIIFPAWLWLRSFYNNYPLDPSYSDIIPMIQRFNYAFKHGQELYEPFADFGYNAFPTYLPAMWMPFLAADKLRLDYRTWSYILLCVVLLLSFVLLPVKNKGRAGLFLMPFGIFLLFVWNQPPAFGWTVEPMIAGFYLLLVVGIYLQNAWLMGIALVLCLLSRYSILLWVPVFFILLYFFGNKRKAVYTALILLTGMLLIFVLPFLLSHPGILEASYKQYTVAALGEWNGQHWQKAGDLPFQLSQGYGFAIYFYQWGKGDIAQRLKLAQQVHLIVCIMLPLVTLLGYWLKKSKRLPLNWYLLLSLKIYLVVFFAFIQVPYAYLFFTPLLVSSLILVLLLLRPASVSIKKD